MIDIRKMRGYLYRKTVQKPKQRPRTRAGQVLYNLKKQRGELFPRFRIMPAHLLISLPSARDIKIRNIIYPVIKPYAYVSVRFDEAERALTYNIIEPALNEYEAAILKKLKEGLVQIIDVTLEDIKQHEKIIDFLESSIQRLIYEYSFDLNEKEYLKIMYYVYRDFVGYNRIEPMMNDPYVEDIGVDGVGIPIYVVHQKFGSIKTNIVYKNEEELREFVIKLAERCDRYISYAEPLLDGTLKNGSRVQASLAGDVTTRGPTFSIRKFRETPFTPVDMIRLGTASAEMLAYLWFVVENGANVLISGGVSTGKTSFLNTISLFIPEEAKIVSIEDTRELNLPHENWIPGVARVGFTGTGVGEVTMYELLRESFRQNPDYLVVGEVRGKEAYVMFQGMASIPGDEKVLVVNSNNLKRIPISELKVMPDYKTPVFDFESKKIKLLSGFAKIEHPPRKELYRIITKTGRNIVTTADHSLFSWDKDIITLTTKELKNGDIIVIPGLLPSGFNNIENIDLTELSDIRVFAPGLIKRAVEKLGYQKSSAICEIKSISDYYAKFKRAKPSALDVGKFKKLMSTAGINYTLDDIIVRFDRKSESTPARLSVTPEFLRLLGYFVSEGSLNIGIKSSRINLYSKNKEILDDMRKCITAVSGKIPKERVTFGFGSCTELSFNHKVLFEFIKQHIGQKSESKRSPDFIFGLSKENIGHFLSGLYSGDGTLTKNYFGYYTISKQLASDMTNLLLTLGIVATVRTRKRQGRKTTDYEVLFYTNDEKKEFLKYARPIRKMPKIGKSNKNKNKIGDIYLDRVESIEKILLEKEVPVYDLCVQGHQNFIGGFGGILLHNSGHPSISTMHAGSVDDVIKRLQTRPINLSPGLLDSLDIVIVMVHAREKGKSARRVKEIAEIESVDIVTGQPHTNKAFIWLPSEDGFEYKGNSWMLSKISDGKGIPISKIVTDIARRKKLLNWLYENNIIEVQEIVKYLNMYRRSPEMLENIVRNAAEE